MKPTIALHYDKVKLPEGTAYMIGIGGILFIPRLDWHEFPWVPLLVWALCLGMLAMVLPGYAAIMLLMSGIGALGGLLFYLVRKVMRLRQ